MLAEFTMYLFMLGNKRLILPEFFKWSQSLATALLLFNERIEQNMLFKKRALILAK